MTGSKESGPNPQRDEGWVRALLRERGLRYSRPRDAILSYFREGPRHVGAEGIHRDLKARGESLSLSTVYLNLTVLCEAGLLREIERPGGALYDGNVAPHYHIVCRASGEVLDLPNLRIDGLPLGRYLQERIERQTGWKVDEPQLNFVGLSPSSRSEEG